MNYNDRDNIEMNYTFKNGDVSSEIGLLKIHTVPQYNELSNLNYMNMSVDNGDINIDYCYMNGSTVFESNNQISIDYKNKID